MTQLTNSLLETALRATDSWRQAEIAMALKEDPPQTKINPIAKARPKTPGFLLSNRKEPID